MITYKEFINIIPDAGYYINGYKVYYSYFHHFLNYSTIHIAELNIGHTIYCKHDFEPLSRNLFLDHEGALRTCLKKINDDLIVPLESELKLCKDRR